MADAPVPVTTGKPKWTKLATLGLLLAAIGPLLMLAAGLVWGLDFSDDAGFFLSTGAIGLLGAFSMSRSSTWAKVVGVVFAVLMLFGLWWTVFGLFTPGSFFDFVPGLLVLPGALIGIIAGIGAIRATKRGAVTAEPVAGEKRGLRIVLTVVIVLAVVSAALTFLGRSTADEADADSVIALSDFEFPEDEISLAAGSTVLVRNDDPFLHTFTIEELDIDVVLGPGTSELVEIPADPGTYVVFCQPHTSDSEDPSEDDMAATLTIE
jgi:plastocyanin